MHNAGIEPTKLKASDLKSLPVSNWVNVRNVFGIAPNKTLTADIYFYEKVLIYFRPLKVMHNAGIEPAKLKQAILSRPPFPTGSMC